MLFDRKKGTARLLIFVFLFCGTFLFTMKTHAQGVVPVGEVPNAPAISLTAVSTQGLAQKELVLDGIATAAVKIILNNITNSVVTWINSGFQGNPAFISNPESFFTDVGDQIAGNFIAGTELGFMCEPFSLNIRAALALNYSSTFTQASYCRLSDAVRNTENFTKFTNGDFSQGGWDSWFSISQNLQNNPMGAQLLAENELAVRTARGQSLKLLEANWGQGFLSSRDCVAYEANPADTSNPKCVQYGPIKTPGTVIESQLETTLGTGIRQYELAKDFDEVVNALVGQLVQTVFTKGLSSFGSGGSNYGSLHSTQPNQLTAACSADKTTVAVGELVTWNVYVSGGTGNTTTYTWHGSDIVDGATTPTVFVGYSEVGLKTASVSVTKGGQTAFQICSSQVRVQ